MAPSPDDPYPREAALDNQGLTIDTILKKALVPSMRRMGVGRGACLFFYERLGQSRPGDSPLPTGLRPQSVAG